MAIELKFGRAGLDLMDDIRRIESMERLEELKGSLRRINTLAELKEIVSAG